MRTNRTRDVDEGMITDCGVRVAREKQLKDGLMLRR